MRDEFRDDKTRGDPVGSRLDNDVELASSTTQNGVEIDKTFGEGKSSDRQDIPDDLYEAGIPLKDLSDDQVHQFPGLKREKWW
jgi:hypothetical protein